MKSSKTGEIVIVKGTYIIQATYKGSQDSVIGRIISTIRIHKRSPELLYKVKILNPEILFSKQKIHTLLKQDLKFISHSEQQKIRDKLIIKQL